MVFENKECGWKRAETPGFEDAKRVRVEASGMDGCDDDPI